MATALQDHTQVQPDVITAHGVHGVSDLTKGFQGLRSKQMGNIYFRAIVTVHFSLVSEFRRPTYDLSSHPPGHLSFRHYNTSACVH